MKKRYECSSSTARDLLAADLRRLGVDTNIVRIEQLEHMVSLYQAAYGRTFLEQQKYHLIRFLRRSTPYSLRRKLFMMLKPKDLVVYIGHGEEAYITNFIEKKRMIAWGPIRVE